MLKDIMEGITLLETVPAVGQDTGWMARGRCVRHPDPDLWFAPFEDESPRYAHLSGDPLRRARKKDRDRAKEKCQACPVRAECLRYALENSSSGLSWDGDFGMWGGLGKAERTRLRNMLAAKEAVA